ncbi:PREDICTED: uncharacterized protein LOC108554296, partial [Eufriesea mexicana]|uniref:uncharacterized protein LOC108554296 n=1 Tax=Eufriesea mexicana TaxID=516756 RepID=UPI00083C767E
MTNPESEWPPSPVNIISEVPETRSVACFASSTSYAEDLMRRYSCVKRLRRIVAYCLRFGRYRKNKGPLTAEELHRANIKMMQLLQGSAFQEELRALRDKRDLPNSSKLLPLRPFLDEDDLLRVGGRLQNSALPYEAKHPILLPQHHHLTTIIIRNAHLEAHHAGINTTLSIVRQQYWPINGRNTTRQVVRQCVRCFRIDPPAVNYTMGNLPAARVTEGRPFLNCGIDYCGPFFIKERKFRNRTRVMVYVAVFVCFATKAVHLHLEVVNDMTTETFIAALKRFVARRGICKNIYSDNGTNFVGADHELSQLYRELREEPRVQNWLAEKSIAWHFIPALSPNFGGLWEAA